MAQNERDGALQEKARRLGVPLIGGNGPCEAPKIPATPNPVVGVCGKCGLVLHHMINYSCPHTSCPCGLGLPTIL